MGRRGHSPSDEAEPNKLGLDQIQSLVRAFGILDQIADCEDGLILTDLANRVGLPRSTVHRMLTTMSSLGYVSFETGTNKWHTGHRAFHIGANFTMTKNLARLTRPMMQTLALEAHETVNISVPVGPAIQYVGQVKSSTRSEPEIKPGDNSPFNTSASGKVIMAQWSSGTLSDFLQKNELARRTDSSITLPGRLSDELRTIKARGYALEDEEHRSGLRSVAAPVFNCRGFVRASVSITGPANRFPEERLHALGRLLCQSANRMSNEFGAILAR